MADGKMVTIPARDLKDQALDWAVHKSNYVRQFEDGYVSLSQEDLDRYSPSKNWSQGGQILESEEISVVRERDQWHAEHAIKGIKGDATPFVGRTALEAAMISYVSFCLANDDGCVSVPERLTESHKGFMAMKKYFIEPKQLDRLQILANTLPGGPLTAEISAILRNVQDAQEIKNDPDVIQISWAIQDVQSVRDLDDDQAREVLACLKDGHDAGIGISWDVIKTVADELFGENKVHSMRPHLSTTPA